MNLKWNGLRRLRHTVVVIPFVLLSCIVDDLPIDPDAEKPLSGIVEVDLSADEYSPDIITVEPGTTVKWVNVGPILHTVTPERPTQDGVWPRKEMTLANEVFQHTFTVPGEEYQYYCERHPEMTGWVIVADGKGAVSDTAPPPCAFTATTCQ
jgi:plastocyanin